MIDNDEKIIRYALNTINTPQPNLKEKIHKKLYSKKRTFSRKALIGICTACLSLIFCIPVMASSPSFQKLLSSINSNFQSNLYPINMISEDNGIKMEILAAMNDEDMAVIYLTLQDMKGNRIDETTDLYESYSLSKGNAFGSQLVNYDAVSKTATFAIQINGGKNISEKEIELSLNGFLSGKKDITTSIDNLNLGEILKTHKPNITSLNMKEIPGCGGTLAAEYVEKGLVDILRPNELNFAIPNVDFVSISNLGIIDGRLHLQTKWSKNDMNEHGTLFFTDDLGNKLNTATANITFGVDNSGAPAFGNDYVEYIIDLTHINLDEVNLNGNFISNENYTKGNWETRFKLQPVTSEKVINGFISASDATINNITISPMGITLIGENITATSIKLKLVDGTTETLDNFIEIDNNIKFIPSAPLDPARIESIEVAEKIIEIK